MLKNRVDLSFHLFLNQLEVRMKHILSTLVSIHGESDNIDTFYQKVAIDNELEKQMARMSRFRPVTPQLDQLP